MRRLLCAIALLLAGLSSPAFADNCSGHNADAQLLSMSGQAAATVTSADQSNCTGRGVLVVVDLTTVTTASVVVTIQGKDVASGKYYTLLAGASKTSTGTTLMVVYPGTTASSNVDVNYPVPRTWRVSVTVSDSGGTAAVTGTIGASVIQ